MIKNLLTKRYRITHVFTLFIKNEIIIINTLKKQG